MDDNDMQLLDEAMRLCNEVAKQVREANTYYRNRQRHVSKAGEYGAVLAELCAERIGRLQAIRSGQPEPKPKALGRLFLSNCKPPNYKQAPRPQPGATDSFPSMPSTKGCGMSIVVFHN